MSKLKTCVHPAELAVFKHNSHIRLNRLSECWSRRGGITKVGLYYEKRINSGKYLSPNTSSLVHYENKSKSFHISFMRVHVFTNVR